MFLYTSQNDNFIDDHNKYMFVETHPPYMDTHNMKNVVLGTTRV